MGQVNEAHTIYGSGIRASSQGSLFSLGFASSGHRPTEAVPQRRRQGLRLFYITGGVLQPITSEHHRLGKKPNMPHFAVAILGLLLPRRLQGVPLPLTAGTAFQAASIRHGPRDSAGA